MSLMDSSWSKPQSSSGGAVETYILSPSFSVNLFLDATRSSMYPAMPTWAMWVTEHHRIRLPGQSFLPYSRSSRMETSWCKLPNSSLIILMQFSSELLGSRGGSA